jgi:methionine-rich copper-binding protein CopC
MRIVRMAAAAALLVMAGTGAALAHARMTASVPEDGATVPAGLSHIEMKFSHPMRLALLRVRRAADDQEVVIKGGLPKTFAAAAKVTVDALPPGAYHVTWTAISEDGHVAKGQFAFTVSAAAAPAQ